MKVLSLISQKGGVGKTTLATALAVAASQDGKRVVMPRIAVQPHGTPARRRCLRRHGAAAIQATVCADTKVRESVKLSAHQLRVCAL